MGIKIKRRDGTIEVMDLDVFSRWMCLMEAFYVIQKKAEEMKLDNWKDFIKPMAIEEYINERFHSMKYDVECEVLMGNL